MQKAFQQIDDDTEGEEVKRRTKSGDHEDMIRNQYQYDNEVLRYVLEYSSHSKIQAHKKKIMGMAIDQNRTLIYSSGVDRKLNVTNIYEKKIVSYIKPHNATMRSLVIDQDLKRLFAGSKEGQLFIFNIEDLVPIVMHSFNNVAFDITGPNYIRHMELDFNKNLLFALFKGSQLVCIQIDSKQEKQSTMLEVVRS